MYEHWKAAFERDGQATIRHSRKTGFWLLIGGLGFIAAGLYLLTMPLRSAFASFFGTASGRIAGGLGVLLGLLAVMGALAFFLVRPALIVKLDGYGVTPGRGLPIAWDEITGVSLRRVHTMTLPTVRVRVRIRHARRAVHGLAGTPLEDHPGLRGNQSRLAPGQRRGAGTRYPALDPLDAGLRARQDRQRTGLSQHALQPVTHLLGRPSRPRSVPAIRQGLSRSAAGGVEPG